MSNKSSKRQLMDQLRALGTDAYREGMQLKETERIRLRGLGASREEATNGGWEAVKRKYFPEAPEAAPAAEVVSGALADGVDALELAADRPALPPVAGGGENGKATAPGVNSESTVSYWECLNWAARALGLSDQEQVIGSADAPDPRAWALFVWGQRSRKEFFSVWAAEGRKQPQNDGRRAETRRQVEEIDEMIDEVLAEIGLGKAPEAAFPSKN